MVHDCQLWRPVCQDREVMTPCISPLWTKTGVLQKLPANGLHISLVTQVIAQITPPPIDVPMPIRKALSVDGGK